MIGWAEARVKIARVTLTIKLDGNWNSFQLANSAPPLSVTDSAIAPSARIDQKRLQKQANFINNTMHRPGKHRRQNTTTAPHAHKQPSTSPRAQNKNRVIEKICRRVAKGQRVARPGAERRWVPPWGRGSFFTLPSDQSAFRLLPAAPLAGGQGILNPKERNVNAEFVLRPNLAMLRRAEEAPKLS